MKYTSTVTKKDMITLPVDIRRRCSMKTGSKVRLIEGKKDTIDSVHTKI